MKLAVTNYNLVYETQFLTVLQENLSPLNRELSAAPSLMTTVGMDIMSQTVSPWKQPVEMEMGRT